MAWPTRMPRPSSGVILVLQCLAARDRVFCTLIRCSRMLIASVFGPRKQQQPQGDAKDAKDGAQQAQQQGPQELEWDIVIHFRNGHHATVSELKFERQKIAGTVPVRKFVDTLM